MIFEREYGTATTVSVPLIAFSTTSFHNSITSTVFAAGDTKISKDFGGFTNTATTPTGDPSNFMMILSLTAAEMQAKHIEIRIVDSGAKVWEDQMYVMETYGDTTGAQHRFNRNVNTVQASLTAAQTGVTIATVTNVTNGVTVSSITTTAFPFSASLTAAQTGVTIATVTNVTNGVLLTTTAVLNNLAASATAQINAEVDTALADASVTAVAMNKIHDSTAGAAAVWGYSLTTGAVVADTAGERIVAIDNKLPSGSISGFDPTASGVTLTASQVGVTIATVTNVTNGVTVSSITSTAFPLQASLTANNAVVVSSITTTAFPFSCSLTAAQTGVTIATVTQVTNAVTTTTVIPSATDNASAIWHYSLTTSAFNADTGGERLMAIDNKLPSGSISGFDPAASGVTLTASQAGVTIATVTNVTNGVNLTSTAILNNLAASATAQINAEADAALADASVTAVAMNKIHSATDAATATFAATITSTSFNTDTFGRRATFLDRAISSVTAAINSTDVANAVWGATQSTYITAGTFGDMLDATISGFVAGGDWSLDEKAQIRHALGVSGSTTSGSGGIIHSISTVLTNISNNTTTLKASLTAAQTGVTIATVTNVTNGVLLTTTAILNNLAASATAQINAEVDTALADASVTAVAMNKIHDATAAGSAVWNYSLTTSAFNADTSGERLMAIDNGTATLKASLTAAQTGVTIATVTNITNGVTVSSITSTAFPLQASLTANNAVVVSSITSTAFPFAASLTAAQTGVTIATVTNVTNGVTVSSITSTAFPLSASLTANQAGVTVATVTNITNGVNLTSTAVLNNFGASATTQIFSATITSTSFNADTFGKRFTDIDNNVTTLKASLTSNNAVVVSSITSTAFPFAASLTANQSGVTVATVTNVTNGVTVSSITSTAFPFASSLTANQAGVTIATVTQVTNAVTITSSIPTATDNASAVFAATITTTSFNADTVGERLALTDNRVDAAITTRSTFDPTTSGVTGTATFLTAINTEVVDVMAVDTIAERTAGIPTATPTFQAAMSYLYMTWRNGVAVSTTKVSVSNDAGTTITSATVADDGTTFTRGEFA